MRALIVLQSIICVVRYALQMNQDWLARVYLSREYGRSPLEVQTFSELYLKRRPNKWHFSRNFLGFKYLTSTNPTLGSHIQDIPQSCWKAWETRLQMVERSFTWAGQLVFDICGRSWRRPSPRLLPRPRPSRPPPPGRRTPPCRAPARRSCAPRGSSCPGTWTRGSWRSRTATRGPAGGRGSAACRWWTPVLILDRNGSANDRVRPAPRPPGAGCRPSPPRCSSPRPPPPRWCWPRTSRCRSGRPAPAPAQPGRCGSDQHSHLRVACIVYYSIVIYLHSKWRF